MTRTIYGSERPMERVEYLSPNSDFQESMQRCERPSRRRRDEASSSRPRWEDGSSACLLGATPISQNGSYAFEMMEQMVGLHLNDKTDGNLFNFLLLCAYHHYTIPCPRHACQKLKNMLPACFEERQRCAD